MSYDFGADLVRADFAGAGEQRYFTDALGSTTTLAQSDGAIAARYDYDAWGVVVGASGGSANSIGYTGQRLDNETGLMALGNGERYYAPGLGRFTQQDSFTGRLDVPPSLNRYSYIHNNPVNHTDPSGHLIPFLIALGFLAVTAINVIRQDQEIKSGTRKQEDFSLSEATVDGTIIGNSFRAATGTDAVTGQQLSGTERFTAGVEVGLEFASVAGKTGGALLKAQRAARIANTIGNVAEITQAGIGVYRGGKATAGLIQEGRYGAAGLTAGLTILSAIGGATSARSLRQDLRAVQKAANAADDVAEEAADDVSRTARSADEASEIAEQADDLATTANRSNNRGDQSTFAKSSEELVSETTGIPLNRQGRGQQTIPASTGGKRVPDLKFRGLEGSIRRRGTIIEVKASGLTKFGDLSKRSREQILDMVTFVRRLRAKASLVKDSALAERLKNAHVEVFSDLAAPTRGKFRDLIEEETPIKWQPIPRNE